MFSSKLHYFVLSKKLFHLEDINITLLIGMQPSLNMLVSFSVAVMALM